MMMIMTLMIIFIIIIIIIIYHYCYYYYYYNEGQDDNDYAIRQMFDFIWSRRAKRKYDRNQISLNRNDSLLGERLHSRLFVPLV